MMISEVSSRYDLSRDTLRYYERIGLIPRVNRNKTARGLNSSNVCETRVFRSKC